MVVTATEPNTPVASELPSGSGAKTRSRPQSPTLGVPPTAIPPTSPAEDLMDDDPFDVRETVNVLTLQFLSDHAETRIAALEWLLMLHLKAPNKVSARHQFGYVTMLTLVDPVKG
jgi:vacuole morphology and inheritance protein 14